MIEKPLKIQKFLREDGSMSDLKDDPYKLKINTGTEGRRILFKYNQIKSDLSLDIVQEARGLILDRKNNWEVLSFPFKKFFNYGEDYAASIDWDTAKVFEKCDGTCSVLYHYDNEWKMHTLGTVEGEGPVHVDDLISVPFDGTFSDLFFYSWNQVYGKDKLEGLNENFVYVFELMTPYNIVVKEHKNYKLKLLAVRNRNTLNEYDLERFSDQFDIPHVYDFSDPNIDELKNSLGNFQPDEEGYVVCDKDFNRIKLKNPDYVMRHKMRDSVISRKNGVLEVVLNEEEDDFISTFPDLKSDIKDVKSSLQKLISFLENKYESFDGQHVDPQDSEERKEFALKVKENVPHSMQGYMFQRLTSSKNFEEIVKNDRTDSVSESIKFFNNNVT